MSCDSVCVVPRLTRFVDYQPSHDSDMLTALLQDWKDAALILDEYMHFNEWKHADEDPFYDWRLVRKVGSPPYRMSQF